MVLRSLPSSAWQLSRSGHGGVSGQRRLWRGEAGELEREPAGVAVVDAQLGGDVRYLVQVQDPGDRVADGGLGLVRAADTAGVLTEAGITEVMVHFDCPVAAQVRQQVSGPAWSGGRLVMPGTATAPGRLPSRR